MTKELSAPPNVGFTMSQNESGSKSSYMEDNSFTTGGHWTHAECSQHCKVGKCEFTNKNRKRRRNDPCSEDEAEEKRLLANCQERQRANKLSQALNELRSVLPQEFTPIGRRLSKIRTLRLAVSYIRGLKNMLHHSNSFASQNPKLVPSDRSDHVHHRHLRSSGGVTSSRSCRYVTSSFDEGYSSFNDPRRLSDASVGLECSSLTFGPSSEETEVHGPGRNLSELSLNTTAFSSSSQPERQQPSLWSASPSAAASLLRTFGSLGGVDEMDNENVAPDVSFCSSFSMSDEADAAASRNQRTQVFHPSEAQFQVPGSFSFSSTPFAKYSGRQPRFDQVHL